MSTGGNSPGGAADSAGQAWAGREIHTAGFADDFGVADPALLSALRDREDETGWMAALADARLIVPIVAAPGEVEDSGGLQVEKSTDMAVVTLTAPDGQRALPVFTSLETLQGWDAAARPSPVTAVLAAQAAISEQCDVLALDVAASTATVLRPSMVWALAQRRPWLPAHTDPFVQEAVRRAAADEMTSAHDGADAPVAQVSCEAGEGAALRIVLQLRPGLDEQQVRGIAQRIGERIATDGEARARIDAVTFAIRTAP